MADVVVGAKLEADASGAINNVKNFKQELRLAQQEVVMLSEKFGATSKETAAAAKKAAELKDKIGDATQLIDAFNPDTKFRAFASSIQTVVGGFTALTGAMGLLGVESEEVQKTLLKVQSALALSQGISQLQEGIGAIKNLGSVLVNTLGKSGLIGIAIAGVGALAAAIFGLFDGASYKTKELNNSLKELGKAELDATKEVNLLKSAFKQAEAGVITKKEALDKYNNGIGKTIGFAKDLDEAERLTAENAKAYIEVQGLKAQANYLIAKSAESAAQAMVIQAKIEEEGARGRIGGAVKDLVNQMQSASIDFDAAISKIEARIKVASSGFKTVSPVATGPAAVQSGKTQKDIERETDLEKEKRYQSEYEHIQFDAEQKRAAQAAIDRQAEEESERAHLEELASINTDYTNEQIDLGWLAVENKRLQQEATAAIAEQGANVLNAASQLLGEETAAGKVLAVAAATISTYLAINKTLAAFAGRPIPGYAIAQAIATGVFGLAQVKKILAVNIPKRGGSSSSAPSAPLSPQLPQSTSTRLDRDQLNQIGNAAVRAFVVETDVTTNQERIRRLNRAARIG